jgi:predicted ATPase
MGAIASAHIHFVQGIAFYDPQHRASALFYVDDPVVLCYSRTAWVLWYLGYSDQGLARKQEAVTLAQQTAYPFSLVLALGHAALFHQFRREVSAVQEYAEASLSVAQEQGFPQYKAYSAILYGWALAHQGLAQDGMAQLHQGLMTYRATGAAILRPYWLALLAEAHEIRGEPEVGLTALAEALTLAETTGERWYESELYRLKGALLLQQNAANQAEAEHCFQQAITIAQNQQAKSFELRSAMSLSRLWQQQGKRQEAHDLLAPVYGWFTEGFDTADLIDAKALLDELA